MHGLASVAITEGCLQERLSYDEQLECAFFSLVNTLDSLCNHHTGRTIWQRLIGEWPG